MDKKLPFLLLIFLVFSSIVAAQLCPVCEGYSLSASLFNLLIGFIVLVSSIFFLIHILSYIKVHRKEGKDTRLYLKLITLLYRLTKALPLIVLIILPLFFWALSGGMITVALFISIVTLLCLILQKRKKKSERPTKGTILTFLLGEEKSTKGIILTFLFTSFIPLILITGMIWVYWYPYVDRYADLSDTPYEYETPLNLDLIWFFRYLSLALSLTSIGLLLVVLKLKDRIKLVSCLLSLASMFPVILGIATLSSGVIEPFMICVVRSVDDASQCNILSSLK